MKKAIFAGVIFIFAACVEKKKEVLRDMKDLTPKSERTYSEKNQEEKDSIQFDFDAEIAREIGVEVMEFDKVEAPMFPDRFHPISATKLHLQLKKDGILFCQWSFKDSTQTKNAFYNWLDCFGEKCKSIKFGETINFQNDNFLLFVNDTLITYITSAERIEEEAWLNYFKQKNGLEDWKIFLQQGTRAKAKWFAVEKGKKRTLID
jgi:hypothetical protein